MSKNANKSPVLCSFCDLRAILELEMSGSESSKLKEEQAASSTL